MFYQPPPSGPPPICHPNVTDSNQSGLHEFVSSEEPNRFYRPHEPHRRERYYSDERYRGRPQFDRRIEFRGQRSQNQRLCRYYAQGHCYRGDRCTFAHNEGGMMACSPASSEPLPARVTVPTMMAKRQMSLSTATTDQLAILRKVELSQFLKRFPSANEVKAVDGSSSFVVAFMPTDPDWPFDIKVVHLTVAFSNDYPKVVPSVEVSESNNGRLPSILTKHLTRCVRTYFENVHEQNAASDKVELTFRPFLRWFDRQLEEMFTTGLKLAKRDLDAEAAGIIFVPFNHLPGAQAETGDVSTQSTSDVTRLYPQLEDLKLNDSIDRNDDPSSVSSSSTEISKKTFCDPTAKSVHPTATTTSTLKKTPDSNHPVGIDLKSPNKGTEIMLRNLQLGENVASIICHKVRVTIQCSRCKTQHDISADAKKCNVIPCVKCHNRQQMSFRPSLMHPFSSVLGYLDLDGCQAFDLPIVDCELAVDCLTCNKQMKTDGLHYGQQWTSWCHNCNAKFSVYIDSAKFRLLQPNKFSEKRQLQLIKLDKKDKRVRDPAIQEGRPLPSNGTCRHFKKSYRWFRFPCCGKAYPCDLCHNEKELEHEMKFANRIICGFCAKEQPYSSNKPCVACESAFNHIGKGHWEGGKGCRDKIRMNKSDNQKYSGVNKTISKKSSDLKDKSKKKPTSS